MKLKLILSLVIISAIPAARGVTLISDNFDTVANAGNIEGRTPSSGTLSSSESWNSSTANILGNGSEGLSVTYPDGTGTTSTAIIDLGTTYLSDNKGIYEISLDITHPSGSSNTSWIGVGFANGDNTNSNFVGNSGNPWMLYRLNGQINVYGKGAISDPRVSNATTTTTGAATGAAHTFKIILDTSASNWVMRAFVDSYEFDLDSMAPGNSYTFADNENPTSQYVGFSTNTNGSNSSVSTIDNFKLDFTAVPEPSALLLGAIGLGTLLRRRRR